MRIAGPHAFDPEAVTRVPCPACRKGMVTVTVNKLILEALKDEPQALPVLITEVRDTVPEK